MVRNVIQVVYREVRGLHQAAYVLAVFAVGSQVLALIRDRLLAHQFGAGIELDLYYTAFRIPDLLYVLFASTLSVYVLIPFIAERIDSKNSERARALLSQVFSLFLVLYIGLAIIIALAAPWIVELVFPGFTAYHEELILLVRILLLQPFFLGISSLLGVITQFNYRFVLYALSPLVYNIGIIFGLLFFYPNFGLPGLVLGVVLGALGHLLIQIPFISKSELAPRLVSRFSFRDMRLVMQSSVPRALTLSLHQFVLLGLVGFASVMAEGSVSVFQFAFNLQSVPLTIIGISYSVAAFPLLAQLHAEGKFDAFGQHIITALRHIIFWSLPVMALLVVIRAQFVRVILGSGAFDWNDTRLTAAVLAVFIFSLTAQAVYMFIVRALYASGNTRLPFYTTLFSSMGALIFSLVLYIVFLSWPELRLALETLMRLQGVTGTEVLALPLGYTIAMFFNCILLLILSQKQLMIRVASLGAHLLRALAASLAAGVSAYVTLNFFVFGLNTETLIGIFLQGFIAGLVGIVGAGLTYYILQSPELREVYKSFHRRIFKTEVVIPQDEDHLAV